MRGERVLSPIQIFLLVWGVSALSQVGPSAGWAQEATDSGVVDPQWRARVEDARRRSQEFVAKARAGTLDPLEPVEDEIKAADSRAMKDPSLQQGDIVSTSKGFFIFTGRDDADRQARDFVPVPDGLVPAARARIR